MKSPQSLTKVWPQQFALIKIYNKLQHISCGWETYIMYVFMTEMYNIYRNTTFEDRFIWFQWNLKAYNSYSQINKLYKNTTGNKFISYFNYFELSYFFVTSSRSKSYRNIIPVNMLPIDQFSRVWTYTSKNRGTSNKNVLWDRFVIFLP